MGYHRSDKQGSDVEKDGEVKSCVDCGTTKTPLWRSGPAGPKSLCNACGIKNRKKRGSGLGVTKSSEEKRAKKLSTNVQRVASSSNSNNRSFRNQNSSNSDDVKLSQSLKKKLVPLGQEVVFQRSIAERLRRRLGEEEQAAMLLMALSCGYVH